MKHSQIGVGQAGVAAARRRGYSGGGGCGASPKVGLMSGMIWKLF